MPEHGPRKRVRILILLAAAMLLIAVGVIALVVHFSEENFVSTKLTLSDGMVFTVAGVDYGTNHVLGSRFMRWAASTPPSVQAGLKKLFGPRAVPPSTLATATPTLVVWLDSPSPPGGRPSTATGTYEVYLADTNGFVSGANQFLWPAFGTPLSLQFNAFPRRGRFLGLHVFSRNAQGKMSDCGMLNILNPEYRNYPQWKPETLPVTRRAGDVEATLEQFGTGQGQEMSYTTLRDGSQVLEFRPSDWSSANESVFRLGLKSLGDTNQLWRVDHVEVSDATGNRLQSMSVGWGMGRGDIFEFNPGLWADEAAWKLRCEIKRTKGFASNEIMIFKNVPLPEMSKTNFLGWSTNLNGVTVTFDYIFRRPFLTNANSGWSGNQLSEAHFHMKGLTNDYHFDLQETHTDSGTNVESRSTSWSNDGGWQEHGLDIPTEAKSLDFTFAVHQGRWVEFMVKPETGPVKFVIPKPKR